MKADAKMCYVDQLVTHYLAAEIAAEADSGVERFRAMAESSLAAFLNGNRMVLFRLNGSDAINIIELEKDGDTEDVKVWKEAIYHVMQTDCSVSTGNSPEVISYVLSCLGMEYAIEVGQEGIEYFEEIFEAELRILLEYSPHIWCVNVWTEADEVIDFEDVRVEALYVDYGPRHAEAA